MTPNASKPDPRKALEIGADNPFGKERARGRAIAMAFGRRLLTLPLATMLLCGLAPSAVGAADLYMRDLPSDTGGEPDSGIMWTSEDIWNRTAPIPGYNPSPFPSPFSSNTWPTWMQTQIQGNNKPIHDDPEFRDPLFSTPNYLYVLVSNKTGSTTSAGTERLRVYWAKASTGLAWDTQWVDYVPSPNAGCPSNVLYGIEITKPRVNAATLSPDERTRLANDIVAVDALYFGSDLASFWDKQDQIHQATHVHCGPAFLPWHRELVNRFEVMLRKVDPTITIPYWDWTTDPAGLFTSNFMGSPNGRAGAPFDSLDNGGSPVGSRYPDYPSETPYFPGKPPASIDRAVETCPGLPAGEICAPWTADDDTSVLNMIDYPSMRNDLSGLENLHNESHLWIGGTIANPHTSFQDPFVFLIHSQTDRLFAKWQRDISHLGRLDAAQVYGSDSNTVFDPFAYCQGHYGIDGILTKMKPWDGTFTFGGSAIYPWTNSGGHIVIKDSRDSSVVSPPFYDDVPLSIPVLQPGQSAILEIPWYPPNPADFAPCFPGDAGHVCLLARIETQTSAPYGMSFPEGTDLGANVANNNNIIWRNVRVVDLQLGSNKTETVIVRNLSDSPEVTKLVFDVPPGSSSFFDLGTVTVNLGPELYQKWTDGGNVGDAIIPIGNSSVIVTAPGAYVGNMTLDGGETHSIATRFHASSCDLDASAVRTSSTADFGQGCSSSMASFDVEQFSTVMGVDHIVGGMRYELHIGPATVPMLSTFNLIALGVLMMSAAIVVILRRGFPPTT